MTDSHSPGAIDQGHCDRCGISLGDWTEDGLCGDCQNSADGGIPLYLHPGGFTSPAEVEFGGAP